jgi:hypothetical protein
MDYHLADFRKFLESKVIGATCSLRDGRLEIILPHAFRKQDHLGVFDDLMSHWRAPFVTSRRGPDFFIALIFARHAQYISSVTPT